MKIIETNRLLLTPFTEKHLNQLYVSWLNNPDIMRYSEQRHKTHTLESCRMYLDSYQNTPNMLWAIEDKANNNVHIGNINTYINIDNQLADIGILIGEIEVQGKGYGFESFKAVSGYLFNNSEVRKVTAGTVSLNKPMIRIMQKMKMRDDGVRKQHYLLEGKEVNVIYMALFREDWIEWIEKYE
jgi:RimJ/RimL family protein N-acetyltransferase